MKKILLSLLVIASLGLNAQDVFKFGVTQSSKQVATASKNNEKITDAPGIISVISKEEIANFGSVSSLWDILNRATGIYMLHAGVLTWNVASIRGQHATAYDNHVLILLNGRPMREGISGGFNSLIYNSFPVESIERIEIIRGPGSVLYGSNAFAGVINIITKKATGKSHFQANVQAGSFNTKAINIGGGIHINDDFNINIGGRWYDDDGSDFGGVFDAVIKENGQVISPSEKRNENWSKDNNSIFLNINYKKLSASAGYGAIQPFSFVRPIKWETQNAKAGEEINPRRYFADLGYSADLNHIFSISANLTYNGIEENAKPGELKAKSDDLLAELSLQASPSNKLNIIVGGYYELNHFFGRGFIQAGTHNKRSLYSQLDYKPIKKIKFIIGAQLNASTSYAPNLSPRAGIIFNINDNFGIKSLYSTAFRAPFPEETDVIHPVYTGNPTLTPELINTAELQAFYHKGKLRTGLTLYRSRVINLIKKSMIPSSDTTFDHHDRTISYFNKGNGIFYGIEWELKYKISRKLTLFANATYQQNESLNQGEDGTTIKNPSAVPHLMAKGGIMYNGDKISGGIFNAYFGEPIQTNYMLEQLGKPELEELNPSATAYNLLSLNVDFHLLKIFNVKSKYDVTLGVYGDNLLNESIWFPEFVLRTVNTLPLHTERAFYGKLAFKF
jgi:outer membrane receptor for ferrienterochelin and colicin